MAERPRASFWAPSFRVRCPLFGGRTKVILKPNSLDLCVDVGEMAREAGKKKADVGEIG